MMMISKILNFLKKKYKFPENQSLSTKHKEKNRNKFRSVIPIITNQHTNNKCNFLCTFLVMTNLIQVNIIYWRLMQIPIFLFFYIFFIFVILYFPLLEEGFVANPIPPDYNKNKIFFFTLTLLLLFYFFGVRKPICKCLMNIL